LGAGTVVALLRLPERGARTRAVVAKRRFPLQHPRRSAGARFRIIVLLLLASLAAAPAALVTAASADPAPSFLIEKISVARNRRPASAHIVLAESLLVAGRVYSEEQLRTAIYRIKRLPFIVDADFALEKGSERGRYGLVITIEESRPLFVGYDLETQTFPRVPDVGLRQTRLTHDTWIVGTREFVGSDGLVFGSVAEGLYQAGYTQYEIFGHGSFLSASLSSDHDGRFLTPSLSAGIPLTVNQSLRATASWARDKVRGEPDEREEQGSIELDWLYDTTDDPIFPTLGTQSSLAGSDLKFRAVSSPPAPQSGFRSEQEFRNFSLSVRRYWPVSNRQSVSLGFTGSAYRVSQSFSSSLGPVVSDPYDTSQASLLIGHSFDFISGERARRWGDLRLETTAEYQGSYTDNSLVKFFGERNLSFRPVLRTGLVFRNPWGVVRLGLSYLGKFRG
jgi:hypothetical protein